MADTLHLEIVTAGGAAVDTQAAQVTRKHCLPQLGAQFG